MAWSSSRHAYAERVGPDVEHLGIDGRRDGGLQPRERSAVDGGDRQIPGRFLFLVGDAHAEIEVQQVRRVPGEATERGRSGPFLTEHAGRRGIADQGTKARQPGVDQRYQEASLVDQDGVAVLELGVFVVGTDDVVEGVALRGREADLLAELIEVFVQSDVEDVRSREVTVAQFVEGIGREPGDRGQRAPAELPIERQRVLFALVVAGLGPAGSAVIERVVEHGRIRAQRRKNLRVRQAREGARGGRALVVDLDATTFLVELAHFRLERRHQVLRGIELELPADTEVVAAGLAPTDRKILDEPVRGECASGETTAYAIAERT